MIIIKILAILQYFIPVLGSELVFIELFNYSNLFLADGLNYWGINYLQITWKETAFKGLVKKFKHTNEQTDR